MRSAGLTHNQPHRHPVDLHPNTFDKLSTSLPVAAVDDLDVRLAEDAEWGVLA